MEKINGEHGAIIGEIHNLALGFQEIKTAQELQHKENKEQIVKLMEKTDDLPCVGHKEQIKNFEKHIEEGKKWRMALVLALIGLTGLIATFLTTWGRMVEAHENIEKTIVKMNGHIQKDEARWEYYKLPEYGRNHEPF